MGAFKGGLTYRRYVVREPLPDNFHQAFDSWIWSETFREIDPASEVQRAVGWVAVDFALNTSPQHSDYRFNEYVALGMRIDTLVVPGPTLALYAEAEVRRVKAELNRDSLNRYEHAEIKERVRHELRRKMLPAVKSIDMIWNITTGEIRFFGTARRDNEEFLELFEDTFNMVPLPDNPYTMAMHAGLSDGELDIVTNLDPVLFVDAVTLQQAKGN